jgi:hypothetical protein
MSKNKASDKNVNNGINKDSTRFFITVRRVGEKYKFIKSNQEEQKSRSKSRNASRTSNKAKVTQNKGASEHDSSKNNKRKEMDAVSGGSSNRKEPTSPKQFSETGKNGDCKIDGVSNNDADMISANKDLENISEAVAFKAPYVIPSCSQWFEFDKIHEIEQESLSEFFCGKYPSKTPESYKEYRNFMIKLYRENPSGYLSATTCRRHLAGDACAIIRLHAFLELWGLINFNVDPFQKPHKITLNREGSFTKYLVNAANKHFIERSEQEIMRNLGGTIDNSTNLNQSLKEPISLDTVKKINFLSQHKRPYCNY